MWGLWGGSVLNSAVLRSAAVMMLALLLLPVSPDVALAKTYTLSGRLVDSETGLPARGVELAMYAWNEPTKDWDLWSFATAGADGRFSMPVDGDSRPKTLLFWSRSTYQSKAYVDVPFVRPETWSYWSWAAPAKEGDIPAGARRFNVWKDTSLGDISMDPQPAPHGAISGTITEQFGRSVDSVWVTAWRQDPATGTWQKQQSTSTDSSGSYSMLGTADRPLTGKVRIELDPSGLSDKSFIGGPTLHVARTVNIAPGERIHGIDWRMDVRTRIHGAVMNAETKSPVAGYAVEALYKTSSGLMGVATGDWTRWDGTYTCDPRSRMKPDNYVLQFRDPNRRWYVVQEPYTHSRAYYYGQTHDERKASWVTVGEGELVMHADLWLSNKPAVAGKVVNEYGVGLPDVLAQVHRVESNGSLTRVGSDYTDSRGMYSFVCSSGGTYTVRFVDQAGTSGTSDDKAVWLGGSASSSSAQRLSVPSNRAATHAPVVLKPQEIAKASRVFGMDSYASAIAVSREAFADESVDSAVIASIETFPDALSGSNIAGAAEGPLLVTRFDAIPHGLVEELERLGVRKLYLIGGTRVISARQERTFRALGFEVTRLGGADRFATNALTVREAASLGSGGPGAPVFATSGMAHPDALAIAPAVCANGGIVLLTAPNGTPSTVTKAASAIGVKNVSGIGGSKALTSAAISDFDKAGIKVRRIAAGKDRYDTAAIFSAAARSNKWLQAGRSGLASGETFDDALFAGPALGLTRSPLLLTQSGKLPGTTSKALTAQATGGADVTVYGNTRRIKSSVLIDAGSR